MSKKRKTDCLIVIVLFLVGAAGSFWYVKECTSVGNSVNGTEMPVCSVETKEKVLSLTFETAWEDEGTTEILNVLKEYNVKSSFFVTDGWARKYPNTLKRIVREGHDIGSLGTSHKNMTNLTVKEQKKELETAQNTVEKSTGTRMHIFRPPYGTYNAQLIRTARALGYQTVCWSVESLDWKEYGKEELIHTIVTDPQFQNGAIIRLNSEAVYTKEALPEVIEAIEKEGFRIVALSQLLYDEPYHLDVNGRQIKGLYQ